MVIKGERILLRIWDESDAEELSRIANNENISQNMVETFPHPYTLEDAMGWIKIANSGDKKGKNFAIEFGGRLVGGAGFDIMKGLHRGLPVEDTGWGRNIGEKGLQQRHGV